MLEFYFDNNFIAVFIFDVTVIGLIIINAFLNKKINIRLSQSNIVNKQINLLIEK